jgi:hypothetical protein
MFRKRSYFRAHDSTYSFLKFPILTESCDRHNGADESEERESAHVSWLAIWLYCF